MVKRYFCAEYAEYIRFYTRFFPGTFFDPPFSNSLNIQGALWDPILTQIGRNWNKWSQSQFSIPEYHRCKENVNWRRLTNNFLIMLSKGYRYLKVGISSIGGTTTFPAGSWISSYAKLYWDNFQILLKVKEKIQSGAFQKIKFQNFLQPWWSNNYQKVVKLSQSGAFQNVKFQKFLQPWWSNNLINGQNIFFVETIISPFSRWESHIRLILGGTWK